MADEPTEQTDAELDSELLKTAGTPPVPAKDDNDEDEQPAAVDAPAATPTPKADEADNPGDTVPAGGGDDAGAEPEAGKGNEPAPAGSNGAGAGGIVATPPVKPVVKPAAKAPAEDPSIKALAVVTAKIEADDFDPYSPDGRKALLEHSTLSARVEANRVADAVNSWEIAEEEHDIPAKDLRKMWRDSQTEVIQELGEANLGAATLLWKQKVAAAKAVKPAETHKPKGKAVAPTPITAKGGRTVPPATRATPPQPKDNLSDEDELVGAVGKKMAFMPGQRR